MATRLLRRRASVRKSEQSLHRSIERPNVPRCRLERQGSLETSYPILREVMCACRRHSAVACQCCNGVDPMGEGVLQSLPGDRSDCRGSEMPEHAGGASSSVDLLECRNDLTNARLERFGSLGRTDDCGVNQGQSPVEYSFGHLFFALREIVVETRFPEACCAGQVGQRRTFESSISKDCEEAIDDFIL